MGGMGAGGQRTNSAFRHSVIKSTSYCFMFHFVRYIFRIRVGTDGLDGAFKGPLLMMVDGQDENCLGLGTYLHNDITVKLNNTSVFLSTVDSNT